MADLFDPTGAQLAQTGARQLDPPLGNWRTGALAQTSAPVAHSGALPVTQQRVAGQRGPAQSSKRDGSGSLKEQAEVLYADLLAARSLVLQRAASATPYENAFQEAHAALLNANRASLTKPQLFALYDARMHAGHAWNPHRKRLKDAQAWGKAIMSDLQAINQAIGE